MPNMSPKKVEMALQDPQLRCHNFEEVALGYTLEQAIEEADRCLQCRHKPCVNSCPVSVDIPSFIGQIKEGNIDEAYKIIKGTNALPAVCGRVCPQETQCEGSCVRGIKQEAVAIGRLERFAADYHLQQEHPVEQMPTSNGKKVAIIGAGPAGLTCAGDLANKGYDVTIFEALHKPGGVLVYGIPEFRLPKSIVEKEINALKAIGVKIETNMVIGKIVEIDELLEKGYDSIFIGSGAGLPKFMNLEGENLKGVFSANEFLTRFNLMKAYDAAVDTAIFKAKRAAIVGGGNVAMDAARCAIRTGCEEVFIVYRRGIQELPARHEEIEHAMEEGVQFKTLTNPVRIIGDDAGNCIGMECVEMELGEPDESGRRRPIVKEDSTFIMDVDCVIMSIGTSPNPLIISTTEGLEANKWGCLVADEQGLTTREGVYAGGDAVTGAATVILAMGAGKEAAEAMDTYMQAKK